MLIATIGISGSGKSRLGNLLKNKIDNLEVVCPDDVRKKINGSVSSQNNNFKVFCICKYRAKKHFLKARMYTGLPQTYLHLHEKIYMNYAKMQIQNWYS